MAPTGTIIITGGNGQLGSHVAFELFKAYGDGYHLLLAARKPKDESAQLVSGELTNMGASFSWEPLDLSVFASVRGFVRSVEDNIKTGKLPKLVGIVNSAALSGSKPGVPKTEDGFVTIYQTNVLAPLLLNIGLLATFSSSGLIVNISSGAHALGDADYFRQDLTPEVFSFLEEMRLYGSSKILALMTGYAMQRRLPKNGRYQVQLTALDPGGMSGDSHLIVSAHRGVHYMLNFARFLGPVIRLFMKSGINPPSVPAKAVSDLFADIAATKAPFYILDDIKESSAPSKDQAKQEEVWERAITDLRAVEANAELLAHFDGA